MRLVPTHASPLCHELKSRRARSGLATDQRRIAAAQLLDQADARDEPTAAGVRELLALLTAAVGQET